LKLSEQHQVNLAEAHRRHPQQGEAVPVSTLSQFHFRPKSASGIIFLIQMNVGLVIYDPLTTHKWTSVLGDYVKK
jgi:hypothetical protein